MDKKKLLITGYPFTGTTILKSKVGECKNVYEIVNEGFEIRNWDIQFSGDKEFVAIKTPVLPLEIRVHGPNFLTTNPPNSIYKDYYIIFITRNPWNVFSSIIKAGFDPLAHITNHHLIEYNFTISEYLVSAEMFLEASKINNKKIFSIRYEDLFIENNKKIKHIFDEIGLIYDEIIFQNKSKKYQFRTDLNYNDGDKPEGYNLGEMRTWQINQPFQNMNSSDINIPDELNRLLTESPFVRELRYTDPRIK